MYNPTITQPIRDELKQVGIKELTTAEAVKDFMDQNPMETKAVLINSVCGCAAGTARPGFFKSLAHTKNSPKHIASVFAGVDVEAVTTFRTYLAGVPPSSPSLAFFKDKTLVYFLGRDSIEGASEGLLIDSLNLVYNKYFGDAIDETITVKDPFSLLERTKRELGGLMEAGKTTVLDCRDAATYEKEAIPNAKLLDEQSAHDIVQTWDKDRDLTVYCDHGDLSLRAALYLRKHGFTQVYFLTGGFTAWKS
ncbi:hypothetical protein COTS27_01587 [Spirochaetota bacterium]|nr:hypothetical protein COTS27_01587 [Spirochaetota bacterium]